MTMRVYGLSQCWDSGILDQLHPSRCFEGSFVGSDVFFESESEDDVQMALSFLRSVVREGDLR
jgi:hypothetical protein